MICTPWGYRVARVKKFKINVTSHLKINIFIIKDIQISKCDIIFENGRFWAFKGGGVPILCKRVRDAAFFLIIMLVTFAATLLKPQNYVSSRTIRKCVEQVSTSTAP